MTFSADVAAHAGGRLRVLDNDPTVAELQHQLALRGYPLHGTGYYGPRTEAAVRAFQLKLGMNPTGWVDALTAEAIEHAPEVPAPAPGAGQPPWLAKAMSLIGVVEARGNGDNPLILSWAHACGGLIAREYKHDAVPWCKMFTEYCLVSTGFRGIDSLWALDNRKVGTHLAGPAVGSIATKLRAGGGHTFFVLGRDTRGRVVGVGGNQNDMVCRAVFDPDELQHNWPPGYPLPSAIGFKALPLVSSAPLLKSEA